MRIVILLLVLLTAFAALPQTTGRSEGVVAAAPRSKMIVIPNVARAPAPFPVGARIVNIQITIHGKEPWTAASGLPPIVMEAVAFLPLPGVFDPPATVVVPLRFKTDYTVDAAGCDWTRHFTKDKMRLTVSQPGGAPADALRLYFEIDGPEWYYLQDCHFPGGPIRHPAGGVQQKLAYWLATTMGAYLVGNGARFDTPVPPAGDPLCLKRKGEYTGTDFNGTTWVAIYVYVDPCLLPVYP